MIYFFKQTVRCVFVGYATSIFEEYKYTKASQVGGPSYMAPEVSDDAREGKKIRDQKMGVFSFGLIFYEILVE
jgi:serine/threonine protein kinase